MKFEVKDLKNSKNPKSDIKHFSKYLDSDIQRSDQIIQSYFERIIQVTYVTVLKSKVVLTTFTDTYRSLLESIFEVQIMLVKLVCPTVIH